MEAIQLSDKILDDEPDSPGINVQSLLHAVSNKNKIRNDIDDVTFMKELNKTDSPRSVSSTKSAKAGNIFTHLKGISDRIEREDSKRGPPPHYKRFSDPPPATPIASRKTTPQKRRSPSPKFSRSPKRRSPSPRKRSPSPRKGS